MFELEHPRRFSTGIAHFIIFFNFIRKNTYENSENLKIDMQASMYI